MIKVIENMFILRTQEGTRFHTKRVFFSDAVRRTETPGNQTKI